MRQATSAIAVLLSMQVWGCSQSNEVPEISASEAFPGGEGSVSIQPFPSFMLPASNLPQDEKPHFHAGKALAHQPWIKAPTVTNARDGLGPIYNARTCLFCHINGGRGRMPDDNETMMSSGALRLSLPGEDKVNGVVTEPIYGDQIQSQSVALSHQLRHNSSVQSLTKKEVAPEAYVFIDWEKETFTYPDGHTLELRSPKPRLTNLGYGPLHSDTLLSLRNAPPMHGLGLLETISQQDIVKNADPNDVDNNGISGRVNQVWDYEAKKTVPGRFGAKANKSSIRMQTAAAFVNDVGITNPIFLQQPCTDAQTLCKQTFNGNEPATKDSPAVELSESLLTSVVNFSKNLGVPKRRNPNDATVLKGRSLFYQTGCYQCHRPNYVTGESSESPHLAKQNIWPYTDLLIHDMGPALADGRPDYLATGSEWRTPPLWSVGLGKSVNGSDNLLHDGRAQSVEAAILWHGGEATLVKQKFIKLPRKERQALMTFVESL